MFERIGIGTGHCDFCGGYGPVAVLQCDDLHGKKDVEACERCIRAAVKAAELLGLIRKAKAGPPKKVRKATKPRVDAHRSDRPAGAVSSLVPPSEDEP